LFAALGIDVNKIRILARHSGETIMRYVADAPLRSLRSDLGLTPRGTLPTAFAVASRSADPSVQRKLHSLSDAMKRLEQLVAEQNLEIANHRATAESDPMPTFVQHSVTDTVHRLRTSDDSKAICGIDIKVIFTAQPHAHSHRRVSVKTYVPLPSIAGVPALLLCKNCLRSERKAAMEQELDDAALSGDEVGE
jgi:hypothetical protein